MNEFLLLKGVNTIEFIIFLKRIQTSISNPSGHIENYNT
jgi:hypothetical protein